MKGRRLLLETFEERILCSVTAPLDPQGAAAASVAVQSVSAGHPAATNAPAPAAVSHEVIFVSSDLPEAAQLVAALTKDSPDRSFQVVTLDASRDGVAQIAAFLASSAVKFDAIQVLGHGEAGEVTLGATRLDGGDLAQFAGGIAQWGASLNAGADVLFYGCNVAATDAGRAVVQQIARLTGADVAASTDLTGASALGGNWNLEYATGAIQTALGTASGASIPWNHLLGPITISGPATDPATENTTRVFSAANGNAIVISDPDGGLTTATLSVQHGTLTLGGTANLKFITGDGTNDATMTFHGTAVDINAALDGLTFTPLADYHGPAQLSLSVSDLASAAPNLVNGGFEQPAGVATFQFYPQGSVDGWDTSASDGLIEIWKSGFKGVPAFEGSQFAEINATQSSTLSQVIHPGTGGVLEFSFAHRGRAGVDTMNVTATDLGADGVLGGGDDTVLLSENFSDGNTAWGYYERTLNSASGNPVLLAFTSVSTASGDQSIGNFVDGVFFGVPDGAATSATTINIAPGADIVNDSATTLEDTPVAISVLANDNFENPGRAITAVDGQAIAANGPAVNVANGTVALNGAEQLVFTPAADFSGPAAFTYTVTSNGADETGSVGVTVTPVNISVANVAVTEGADPYAVFNLQLSTASTNLVSVDLALVDGTAKSGADFAGLEVSTDGGANWAAASSAVFAPGETSVLVRTAITNDAVFENTENFSLVLSGAANATIANDTSVATITDDDVRQATVSVVGTSDAGSTGANVVPGEVVTYELRLELAEGANAGVTLQDLLPAGLRFLPNDPVQVGYENVSSSITGLAAGTYTNLTADALISSSLTANNDSYGDGTNVFFKLGDLTNNDSDADREFVTVRFNAVVTNTLANQSGTGLSDNVSALLDTNGDGKPGYVNLDGNGDNAATGAEIANDPANDGSGSPARVVAANATVAEPILVLDKQITSAPAAIKAGDSIEYTVTISHGLGSGGTAWGATLADAAPAGLQFAQIESVTLAGGAQEEAAAALGGGGATLGGAWDVPVGGSVTVVYRATVTSDAVVGSTLNNPADLTWTSLASASPDARGSGDGLLGGGGLNDYELQKSAPATLANGAGDFSLQKQVLGDSNAQIGERLTYQLTLKVADGIINGISLNDLLPAGFALVNGSAQFTAGAGVTATGANFTYASNQLTLDIAQLQSAVDGAENTLTITYEADVLNNAANDAFGGAATEVKTNVASASYDPGSGPVTAQDSATVDVVEPRLDIQKTADDSTPHLGQTVTYTIVISHNAASTADAFDLALHDALPPGVSLNAASIQLANAPAGTAIVSNTSTDGGPLALVLNQLALGESATITFTATVSSDPAIIGGTFGGGDDALSSTVALGYDTQPGANANQRASSTSASSTLTVVGGDLAVTVSNGQASAAAGGRLTYTITVTNNGTDTATQVALADTLPASDAAFNAALSTAGASFAGGQVTYQIPTLAAGATQTFTVVVDLAAPTSAGVESVTSSATATQDDVEPTPADNTASATTPLTSAPDYQITVTDHRTSAKPGDTIDYVITVKNVGDQNGTGIVIGDIFSTDIFSSVTAGQGGQVDLANGTVVWNLSQLDAGATATFTLRGTVKSDFTSIPIPIGTLPGQVPDNNAIASTVNVTDDGTGGSDPTPGTNTASDFDDLQPVPKLKITTDDGATLVKPGEKLTYTIVAANTGTQDSTGTVVVSRLPPGAEILGIASSDPAISGTPTVSHGVIVWHFVDPFPADETVTFTVVVRVPVDQPPGSRFVNRVTIFDDGNYGPDVAVPVHRFARDTDHLPVADSASPTPPLPAPVPATPFVFAFDSFHDFASRTNAPAGPLPASSSIDLAPAAILPIMPIYSGTADAGATLVIAIYNARGERIGEQTVLADAGGNWLATFPSTSSRDLPNTVEITQLAAPIGGGDSAGHNLRTYFSPALNPGQFFFESIGDIGWGDRAAPLLGGLGLANPLQLTAAKYGGELLGAAASASGY